MQSRSAIFRGAHSSVQAEQSTNAYVPVPSLFPWYLQLSRIRPQESCGNELPSEDCACVCVLSIEQFSTFARVDFVNSIFYTWCHKYNCVCQEELFSKTSPASGAGDSDVPRCTKSCCFSGCSIIVANVKKSNLQAHGAAKPKEVFVCRKRWQMSSENRVQQVWQAEASLGPAPRS